MKIALFGAGKDGVKALKEIGKDRVYCFLDNFKTGEIENIPVRKINELKEEKEELLIFITSENHWKNISEQLEALRIKNFFIYSNGRVKTVHGCARRLTDSEWGEIYNASLLEHLTEKINRNSYSVQSLEMLRLTGENQSVLEIGCGSGETSLTLAKNGRRVTAIDFSKDSVALVRKAVEETGFPVRLCLLDATKKLPFKKGEFDVAFQAGLLEHFEREKRMEMLRLWRPICKTMVSMIPNANSIAYRTGKAASERDGTWKWGMEMPQSTLRHEFEKAGYVNIVEYTAGAAHALTFLPSEHYLRVALNRWLEEDVLKGDICGQGYLLVTIGQNPDYEAAQGQGNKWIR